MTQTAKTLACLFPLLVAVLMVWSASCARAQVPPVENQLAYLIDWRVVLRSATANSVEVSNRLAVRLKLEYRLAPHWCQTPDNVAFYYAEPPHSTWSLVQTNVFIADRPCRLFVGWHWCSTNDAGRQCEVRLTRL